MKELSLADAFRFLLPGAVAYVYLYICDSTAATQLRDSFGEIEALLLLLVTGSIFYQIYRVLFYNPIALRLQDMLRRKSDNYRTYLKREYKIPIEQAILLWSEIRDKYFSDRYSDLGIYASGIHHLYMTGLLAIPFIVWRLVVQDVGRAVLLFGISAIVLFAAFLNDRYYEDREFQLLKSLPKADIDRVVMGDRKPASASESR